ncbi:hypothetical protein BH23ACT5_BH23ACT5_11160 [soil metagenome]
MWCFGVAGSCRPSQPVLEGSLGVSRQPPEKRGSLVVQRPVARDDDDRVAGGAGGGLELTPGCGGLSAPRRKYVGVRRPAAPLASSSSLKHRRGCVFVLCPCHRRRCLAETRAPTYAGEPLACTRRPSTRSRSPWTTRWRAYPFSSAIEKTRASRSVSPVIDGSGPVGMVASRRADRKHRSELVPGEFWCVAVRGATRQGRHRRRHRDDGHECHPRHGREAGLHGVERLSGVRQDGARTLLCRPVPRESLGSGGWGGGCPARRQGGACRWRGHRARARLRRR